MDFDAFAEINILRKTTFWIYLPLLKGLWLHVFMTYITYYYSTWVQNLATCVFDEHYDCLKREKNNQDYISSTTIFVKNRTSTN